MKTNISILLENEKQLDIYDFVERKDKMKKDYNEAISRMITWGRIRNIKDTDPMKQILKIKEETEELLNAQKTNDEPEKVDAVGDIIQSTISYCLAEGIDFQKCLYATLEEIEPRLGYTIGGCFFKEKDLRDVESFEKKAESMGMLDDEQAKLDFEYYKSHEEEIKKEMLDAIKSSVVK